MKAESSVVVCGEGLEVDVEGEERLLRNRAVLRRRVALEVRRREMSFATARGGRGFGGRASGAMVVINWSFEPYRS